MIHEQFYFPFLFSFICFYAKRNIFLRYVGYLLSQYIFIYNIKAAYIYYLQEYRMNIIQNEVYNIFLTEIHYV